MIIKPTFSFLKLKSKQVETPSPGMGYILLSNRFYKKKSALNWQHHKQQQDSM
jgi:hypothetical protein